MCYINSVILGAIAVIAAVYFAVTDKDFEINLKRLKTVKT